MHTNLKGLPGDVGEVVVRQIEHVEVQPRRRVVEDDVPPGVGCVGRESTGELRPLEPGQDVVGEVQHAQTREALQSPRGQVH